MILILGPVHLKPPAGVTVVDVRTALEMRDAVMRHLNEASIIVKAAAVADYHVREISQHKLKKTAARLTLELDPTPDILAELGTRKGDRLLIGFAAETERLAEEARRKLITKNCDMVVANLVGKQGTGFDADNNEVLLVGRGSEIVHLGPAPKQEIANGILDRIPSLRLALHAAS